MTTKLCMVVSILLLSWLNPNWKFPQPLDTFLGHCPFPFLLSTAPNTPVSLLGSQPAVAGQETRCFLWLSTGYLKRKVPCGLCVVGMSLSLGLYLWSLQHFVHLLHALNCGYALLPQNLLCVDISWILGTVWRSWRCSARTQTSFGLVVLIKLIVFISGMYWGNGSQDLWLWAALVQRVGRPCDSHLGYFLMVL